MTDSTPQGREKGAGERARELAMKAALEIGERLASCAPIWAGDVADIIERALATSALEARLEATQAARELAQILTLEQLQGVSRPTAYWIAKHFGLKVVKNEPSGELD